MALSNFQFFSFVTLTFKKFWLLYEEIYGSKRPIDWNLKSSAELKDKIKLCITALEINEPMEQLQNIIHAYQSEKKNIPMVGLLLFARLWRHFTFWWKRCSSNCRHFHSFSVSLPFLPLSPSLSCFYSSPNSHILTSCPTFLLTLHVWCIPVLPLTVEFRFTPISPLP